MRLWSWAVLAQPGRGSAFMFHHLPTYLHFSISPGYLLLSTKPMIIGEMRCYLCLSFSLRYTICPPIFCAAYLRAEVFVVGLFLLFSAISTQVILHRKRKWTCARCVNHFFFCSTLTTTSSFMRHTLIHNRPRQAGRHPWPFEWSNSSMRLGAHLPEFLLRLALLRSEVASGTSSALLVRCG